MKEATPASLETALGNCKYLRSWSVKDLIERKTWAVDGYVNGYIGLEILDIEMELFKHHAARLLEKEDLYRAIAYANRPLTVEEQRRRSIWDQEQAQRTAKLEAQLETKRQRALLREGHATLTAIRRVLRGADPLPPQASTPAMTSPTS